MTTRLAVVGAALTLAGLLHLGALAKYSLPLGVAVLVLTAILWLVNHRRSRE
ncbi:hypothetical protein [Kribbella pittospori]|uniref:hypothetical protein n=1 Tax=Kribbella pittospori TaxID=722689 RepID=UPI0013F46237|nr:hypothetical protein [Kribbella pittospori]